MKLVKRFSRMLCLVLILTSLFSMSVFATSGTSDVGDGEITVQASGDTGNAIQDIMEGSRFKGAMSSIKWLTDLIDHYFIQIISVVSFFIISAALLKNVCAGAYCANSKFWDKVDDAHKKTEAISLQSAIGYFQGKQFMQTSAGGLKDFLLGIIPNIKAFTDFEDADMEPKAYFMKAIPQMIACVMIGIFIYNGYYRDTAAKVGDMGAVVIRKTLDSVNPESLVNTVFNMTSWPDFCWEGDTSLDGKANLAIAKEYKSLVASNFGDVQSSQDKAYVVNAITGFVQSLHLESITGQAPEGYVYRISGVSGYVAAGDAQSETMKLISGTEGKSDMVYLCKTDMNTLIPATTEMTTDNNFGYVRFTLKLDVMTADEKQASGIDVELQNTEKTDAAVALIQGAYCKVRITEACTEATSLNWTDHTASGTIKLKDFQKPSSEFGIQPESYTYTSPSDGLFTDSSQKTVKIHSKSYAASAVSWDENAQGFRVQIGSLKVSGSKKDTPIYIYIIQ